MGLLGVLGSKESTPPDNDAPGIESASNTDEATNPKIAKVPSLKVISTSIASLFPQRRETPSLSAPEPQRDDDLEAGDAEDVPDSAPFFGSGISSLRTRWGNFRSEQLPNTDPGCIPSLSWTHRILGFACCCGLGLLFSMLSLLSIGNWTKFGLLFTMGNVMSLCSSGFLVGPERQLRVAFGENRRWSSCVYLISIVLTLVCALWLRMGLLVMIFCGVQYAAWIWYCVSYIPGAQRAVRKCGSMCLNAL
uniref:Vesicle transport protein n=1 Tax=Eutreptiella gymnastica TaxID=73025 RepID=A0A7S1N4Q8_9EUGL|mmetsp:Transcript_118381/g.205984  ORF Transcript_118381/g.205984 Transcript_118381/m.205984 type:complete len:249 (+) Transcript_118381:41-787(+)